MEFFNVYEDQARADAYSKLEYPGTYYLAFRDIPAIIGSHGHGGKGLDFGCGTGRSTRFLRELGFDAMGVDISEQMLAKARELDSGGDYRLVSGQGVEGLPAKAFDLIFAAFTFDNIPMAAKVGLFRGLASVLKPSGRIVILVSTPEIYLHEWASFSTKEFAGNRTAKSGDTVLTVMLDVEDRRPVEDILCTDEDYRAIFGQAGLQVLQMQRPLGRPEEPYDWVSETTVAPWAIYVLGA